MKYFIYKFKREVNRIKQQVKALIEFFYEPFLERTGELISIFCNSFIWFLEFFKFRFSIVYWNYDNRRY